jgi:hypothetical protein
MNKPFLFSVFVVIGAAFQSSAQAAAGSSGGAEGMAVCSAAPSILGANQAWLEALKNNAAFKSNWHFPQASKQRAIHREKAANDHMLGWNVVIDDCLVRAYKYLPDGCSAEDAMLKENLVELLNAHVGHLAGISFTTDGTSYVHALVMCGNGSPLFTAAHFAMIEYFCKKFPFYLSLKNGDGKTPLELAVTLGFHEKASLLASFISKSS